MKQPTEQERREFWEWCGFKLIPPVTDYPKLDDLERSIADSNWEYPDGTKYFWDYAGHAGDDRVGGLPPIDLNSIFQYAMPKLIEALGVYRANAVLTHWVDTVVIDGSEPAITLFGDISETIKEIANGLW